MRRRGLLMVLALALSTLAAGCNWSQYSFDASNTGHDLSATAFTIGSVGGLHASWSSAGATASAPRLAVADGRVIAAGPETVSVSAISPPPTPPPGPMLALDAATGAQDWALPAVTIPSGFGGGAQCFTGSEAATAPAVVDGRVLFLDRRVQCLLDGHPASGAMAAAVDLTTGALVDPPAGYTEVPDGRPVLTSDGGVWVSVDHLLTFAGGLYPTSGRVLGPGGLTFTPDPSAQLGEGYRLGTPAVDGTHIYTVGYGGNLGTDAILFAADRSTGALAWKAPLPSLADTGHLPTPSVGNDRVFVSTGSTLLAFDPAGQAGCTGSPTVCTPLWSASTPAGATAEAPPVSRHRVFVRSATGLAAIRTDDGAPLWTASLGSATGTTSAGLLGPPSIADDVLFVGTQDGRLLAFDATGTAACTGTATTCSPIWTATLTGETGASRPVIAGEAVYIGAADPGNSSRVTKFAF